MNIVANISAEIQSIGTIVLIIGAIIHVLFAGAIARDATLIARRQVSTHLVSPMTWAMATLVGGVSVAAIYWFMHHLSFSHLSK
jgi:hypothetical protein